MPGDRECPESGKFGVYGKNLKGILSDHKIKIF
jgi:hypothetical protein